MKLCIKTAAAALAIALLAIAAGAWEWQGATEITSAVTQTGKTYSSNTRDQNALLISNAGEVTINNATVNKSYGSLQAELCRYYGINAAVVCAGDEKNCSVNFNQGKVTATGAGAAGIFCYYADAYIDQYEISSAKERGCAAEYLSYMVLTNSTVKSGSPLDYCAALAAEDSSAIEFYSGTAEGLSGTAAIYCNNGVVNVDNSIVKAHEGPGVVMELESSVNMADCNFRMEPESENPPCAVKIYNIEDKPLESKALFTMSGGYLTSRDCFYVSNSRAQIYLNDVSFPFGQTDTFLSAGKSEYGTPGLNGGDVELNMYDQEFAGNIFVDDISTLDMRMDGQSAFEGCINSNGQEGYVKVTMTDHCRWDLTADSYISELDTEDSRNIRLNGYTLYVNGVPFDPYGVTGVVLNKTSASITVGGTITLVASVTPSWAADKAVTWQSYDKTVATVDQNGKVKGVAPGTTTIRVKTKEGGFTAKCKVTVKEPTVAVTGVTLDKTSASVAVGKTVTLAATVSPSNATNKAVTWSSYDKSIATVDSAGKVTGVAPGTTTIRVKTKDGGFTAKCKVTVKESAIAVTGVALNKTKATLYAGATVTLKATVTPSDATDKSVTWQSYDKTVATVDANGKVTGIAPGATTIRVKTKDGGFTAKCKVTVNEPLVPVTGVTLNKTKVTLVMWETVTLKATVSPSDAANKKVTWQSYDAGIATVDSSGKVTAVSPGATTIRVKTKDGGFTAKCQVTVIVPEVHVTGVALDQSSLTIAGGDCATLTATVYPYDATNRKVTWQSYDESIAYVDSDGVVTGLFPGATTIRVKTDDGGFTAKCKVTVTDPVAPGAKVEGVRLDRTSLTLKYLGSEEETTAVLTATVLPPDAANKEVTWMSYDAGIADVDQRGRVQGISPGTTTIRVKTKDGGFTDKCKVTVN
ncbi:MAG: Ig domain-containing protein [Abditibacteriota bacterium]|nr:Ig domain-containing protein [Abditibacteriota bacterium]